MILIHTLLSFVDNAYSRNWIKTTICKFLEAIKGIGSSLRYLNRFNHAQMECGNYKKRHELTTSVIWKKRNGELETNFFLFANWCLWAYAPWSLRVPCKVKRVPGLVELTCHDAPSAIPQFRFCRFCFAPLNLIICHTSPITIVIYIYHNINHFGPPIYYKY